MSWQAGYISLFLSLSLSLSIYIYIYIYVCIYMCVCVCVYETLWHEKEVTQVQFLAEFNWYVFRVFLLLVLLPYQD